MTPLQLVARRLAALFSRPDGWGPPQSLELQVLAWVEVFHASAGRDDAWIDGTMARYDEFIGALLPDDCRTLAARLGCGDKASPQFLQILADFVRAETAVSVASTGPSAGDTGRRPTSAHPLNLREDDVIDVVLLRTKAGRPSGAAERLATATLTAKYDPLEGLAIEVFLWPGPGGAEGTAWSGKVTGHDPCRGPWELLGGALKVILRGHLGGYTRPAAEGLDDWRVLTCDCPNPPPYPNAEGQFMVSNACPVHNADPKVTASPFHAGCFCGSSEFRDAEALRRVEDAELLECVVCGRRWARDEAADREESP